MTVSELQNLCTKLINEGYEDTKVLWYDDLLRDPSRKLTLLTDKDYYRESSFSNPLPKKFVCVDYEE